nr:SCP2 sterol-binding domain-containing protein [Candidatus Sigynarchaeota archaeon]
MGKKAAETKPTAAVKKAADVKKAPEAAKKAEEPKKAAAKPAKSSGGLSKEDLAEKIENGEFSIDNALDFFKILAEIANKSEEIQDEVEGWDRNLLFNITNGPKITMLVKEGKFDVKDGEEGTPDITLSMNSDVAVGVLSGETDATSAYMAGDLKVQGPLPDAIKFRTLTELVREELEG